MLKFKSSKVGYLTLVHSVTFFTLLVFYNSGAQVNGEAELEPPLPEVYAIKVIGNRMTSTDLILREMTLRPGMVATPELLEESQMRLSSLGLFNRVELRTVVDEGRAVVLVIVTERFYIYPFLIGRWDPSDKERRVYGLGLYHNNIGGRGMRLGGSWWNGYDHGFTLFHQDPWFSIKGRYGLNGFVSYSRKEIKAPDGGWAHREVQGLRLTLARRLSHWSTLGMEGEWEVRSSEFPDYTLTPGNRDRLLTGRLILLNDRRNYRYYPSSGYYLQGTLEVNRVVDVPHMFYSQEVELRKYRRIGSFILAGRIWGKVTQRRLPEYRLLSIPRSRLRAGELCKRQEGLAAAANLELRFPLLGTHYFSLGRIPVAGPYLMELKFGFNGVLFGDLGLFADGTGGVTDDFQAVGGGLQFQLPYLETVHILAGWAPRSRLNEPSIVAGSQVTF